MSLSIRRCSHQFRRRKQHIEVNAAQIGLHTLIT